MAYCCFEIKISHRDITQYGMSQREIGVYDQGPIKGFETTLGVTYTGPAATSIPIGGLDLAENLYGTPPTPDRWSVNLGFIYKFNFSEYNWDVRLNIFNLLDDQKGESFTEYEDILYGQPVYRRTVQYYAPRSFRLSLGLRF